MKRTFHHDRHGLHGITVVVDTPGREVYIGRCDDMDAERIILNDVDVHLDGENDLSKAAYVEKAARLGVWKKHDRLVLSMAGVASVTPLGTHAGGA